MTLERVRSKPERILSPARRTAGRHRNQGPALTTPTDTDTRTPQLPWR
jgi:hypothetical protein